MDNKEFEKIAQQAKQQYEEMKRLERELAKKRQQQNHQEQLQVINQIQKGK